MGEVALVERANQSGSASALEIVDLSAAQPLGLAGDRPALAGLDPERQGTDCPARGFGDRGHHLERRWVWSTGRAAAHAVAWRATSGRSLDGGACRHRYRVVAPEPARHRAGQASRFPAHTATAASPTDLLARRRVVFSSDRGGNPILKVSRQRSVRRVTDDDARLGPAFTPDFNILLSSNRSGHSLAGGERSARQLTPIGH
jgi:hypothetical protein